MNQAKARSYYQELTPEQKHFVDNKTINTTLSIKHWIAFLGKASAYDRYRDNTSKNLLIWIIVAFIVTFIFIIVGVNTLEMSVFAPIVSVLTLLLILLIRKRVSLGKRNLSNYLRNFFMPILEVLKVKAGEDAKMIAALDFRDPEKSLPFEKIEEPQFSRTVKLYSPKMIAAGVTLKDQSYLEVVLMDEIRKMTVRRRKTKFKTKTTHRLFIRLTVMKSVYQSGGAAMPENIELEEHEDRYVYKLKYKEKESSLGVLKPDVLVIQIATLYRLFTALPGVGVPTFMAGLDAAQQQTALNDLLWNDQIFNQYDRDSFSRRSGRTIRDQHHQHTFES